MSNNARSALLFGVAVLLVGSWLLTRRPGTAREVPPQPLLGARLVVGMPAPDAGSSESQRLATNAADALKSPRQGLRAARPLIPLLLECTADGKCGDCRTAADCAPGQGCILDSEARKLVCLASNCQTSEDCAEGQVCLPHGSPTGPTLHRCAEGGLLEEGGECIDPAAPPEGRCALGLVCVLGRCGRQCDARNHQPCTGKELCITMEGEGSGCFSGCSNDGDCGFGKSCRRNGSVPQCVQVLGPECTELHCTAPFKCEGSVGNGVASYECVTSCNPLLPDAQCPEGFLCGAEGRRSRCYQRCTPSQANGCPTGRACAAVVEDGARFGCVSSERIHPVLVPVETPAP